MWDATEMKEEEEEVLTAYQLNGLLLGTAARRRNKLQPNEMVQY